MCFRLNLIDISPYFFVGAENLSLHVVIAVFSHRHRQVNTISLAKSACVTLGYCYCCKWYNYFKTLRYFFSLQIFVFKEVCDCKADIQCFLGDFIPLVHVFYRAARYAKVCKGKKKKRYSTTGRSTLRLSYCTQISFDIVALSSMLSACQMQTLYITCTLVCQRLSGSSVEKGFFGVIRTDCNLNPYI